jgi:FtsZ-binding cell division protein ZapB
MPGMNKGEIIQENLRLKEMVEIYLTHMIRMTETIDELTKENAELKDWKAKWEERYDAGI